MGSLLLPAEHKIFKLPPENSLSTSATRMHRKCLKELINLYKATHDTLLFCTDNYITCNVYQ